MTESKQMRLSLAAKKLDKGMITLIEVLAGKGHRIENNPNAKLNLEQLQILSEYFNNAEFLDNSYESLVTSDVPRRLEGLRVLGRIELPVERKIIKPNIMESPIQKILFGSPGTGKSFKVEAVYLTELEIKLESENFIRTVFHPEYTYGDFMGKLMPLSDDDGKVSYRYYEGHFLIALSKAYKSILENPENPSNIVLVIDEINRGNSASIFGSVFQLLDRNDNGWSSYNIKISSMEYDTLIRLVFADDLKDVKQQARPQKIQKLTKNTSIEFLSRQEIKLPPNLSIIGTMNTSDNSIYYMDSAFKRRWDWEYIDIKSADNGEKLKTRTIEVEGFRAYSWVMFVDSLNDFLKSHNASIRKIEDKQIGYYFIKGEVISKDAVKNKLMFFLWDSVFTTNKNPLIKLLKTNEKDLITFGDFVKNVDTFCKAIIDRSWEKNV